MANDKVLSQCETCAYYDYDDEIQDYICTVSLDEDEIISFSYGKKYNCPHYKFYDEYKFVQKQN